MKENSIEEDIILLEKMKKNCFIKRKYIDIEAEKKGKAIDHILSDYKRVLKENEEWREAYQEEKDKQFELVIKNQELEKRWDNDTHKLQNDLDVANAEIIKLNKELNQENTKCMMLETERKNYFKKYRYHLQQNESLTKKFSDVIPVQKVKDKIEELKQKEKEMHENKNHSNDINKIYKYAVEEGKAQYGIVFLQELIEEREEK